MGSCDCGDCALIKPSGFCREHRGTEPKSVVTPETLQYVTDAFARAYAGAATAAVDSPEQYERLISWYKSFSDASWQFKHCIVVVLVERYDLFQVFDQFEHYDIASAEALTSLITSLVADELMVEHLAKISVRFLPEYASRVLAAAGSGVGLVQLRIFENVMFYGFLETIVRRLLKTGIDWVEPLKQAFSNLISFLASHWDHKVFSRSMFDVMCRWLQDFAKAVRETGATGIDEFAETVFWQMLLIEGSFRYQRALNEKEDDLEAPDVTCFNALYVVDDLLEELLHADLNPSIVTRPMTEFISEWLVQDKIDICHTKPIFRRSVLEAGVCGSISLSLHASLARVLRTMGNERKSLLMSMANGTDLDTFLQYLCLLPLRLFGVMNGLKARVFERNSTSFMMGIESISFKANIQHKLIPLFALIQTAIGMSTNKEEFVDFVLCVFGGFETCMDEHEMILFGFLCFIANIVTDRSCYSLDIDAYVKHTIMMALNEKPCTALEIQQLFWPAIVESDGYKRAFDDLAERVVSGSSVTFKLKDGIVCIPVAPWLTMNCALNAIARFPQHDLIPFPILCPEPPCMNLASVLDTKTLFGVIWFVVSSHVSDKASSLSPSLHYALNLLLLMKKSHQDPADASEYKCSGLRELIDGLPEDFGQRMTVSIEYCRREKMSMVSMLKMLGPVGQTVLEKLGFLSTQIQPENADADRKLRAQRARNMILTGMQGTMLALEDTEPEDEIPECVNCRNPCNVYVLPMTVYKNGMASKLMNTHVSDIAAAICVHPLCQNCLSKEDIYECPVDRCVKNCFLPVLPDSADESYHSLMLEFWRCMDPFCDGNRYKLLCLLVASTVTLEYLSRRNPSALTRESSTYLIKYLFHSIRYLSKHSIGTWNVDAPCELPVASFAEALLLTDDLANDANWPEQPETDNVCHQRQIDILKHAILNTPIHDPDGLPTDFTPLPLPREFFAFGSQEFGSLPVADFSNSRGLCLLTGQVVDLSSPTVYPDVWAHVSSIGGTSLILTLTGSRATLPVVYSSTFGTSTALSPFYLDTYGSDDVGITIGRPLHLNTHILNATLDAWLSGDWLQYLEE